jgi:hypothetical protein
LNTRDSPNPLEQLSLERLGACAIVSLEAQVETQLDSVVWNKTWIHQLGMLQAAQNQASADQQEQG